MKEPSVELIRELVAAVKRVANGELSEVRITADKDSIRIDRTERKNFRNISPEKSYI